MRSLGKRYEMRGLMVGSDAQIIPILTSMLDHRDAFALSPILV